MLNVQAIPSTQAPSSNPTPQSKPEPLLTDIEGLNRHHAFVMNGGKAMVMNFCELFGNMRRVLFRAEDVAQFPQAREQAEKKQQTLNKK